MMPAFLCLLLASAALALSDEWAEGQGQPGSRPVSCCLDYTSNEIPINRLVSYQRGNSRCPKPAIIFTTKRNIRVCANPADDWVKDRMNRLPPSN
ncbi:C-C motif chemokine 8-like [Anolis sagrei]|uniref:C-C motif chemokine 8-like n=1 Tax=Anolis sagrei TaxID=38937 RepID=UPI003521A4B4